MLESIIVEETGNGDYRERLYLNRDGSMRRAGWLPDLGWRTRRTYPKWWGRVFYRKELAELREF